MGSQVLPRGGPIVRLLVDFPKRLAALRKERALTQQALAERVRRPRLADPPL